MKKSLTLSALFVSLLLISCTKDQIDPIQDTPEKAEARLAINTVSNSFLTGNWCITYILTTNGDVTEKYKRYSFAFATNNSLIVKDETNTSTIGKWVVSNVDGKTRITFSVLNNSGFEAISGDWTMMDGGSDRKIIMRGVVDQKSYLTLEKQ